MFTAAFFWGGGVIKVKRLCLWLAADAICDRVELRAPQVLHREAFKKLP